MPEKELPEERGPCWNGSDMDVAFEYYTKPEVLVLAKYQDPDEYQGNFYIIFEYKGFIFLWRGSYGTCDICDLMEGCSKEEGYNVIKDSLTEGNTLQFRTVEHAKKYVEACNNEIGLTKAERKMLDIWFWCNVPLSLFDEAEDTLLIHSSRIYRDDFVKQMLDAELDVSEPLPIHELENLWEENQNE